MDLIKEISKDKLVIMVTHNPELATKYADRLVKFTDGKAKDDSNPQTVINQKDEYKPKKTSMNFFTALKLSGKNIMTKRGRTALTAFACSIGIIGVALVLAISNGFDIQISEFEKGSLSNYPISINQSWFPMESAMGRKTTETKEEFPTDNFVNVYNPSENTIIHSNIITPNYIAFIDNMDSTLYDGISYTRGVSINILKMMDGKATAIDLSAAGFSIYPSKSAGDYRKYFTDYYDVLSGEAPASSTDLVLVVDEYNQLNTPSLKALGFNSKAQTIDFNDFVGTEYRLIYNDDYYMKSGEYYSINGKAEDLSNLYNNDNAVTLNICGVVRIKPDVSVSALPSGIAYSDELATSYIENAKNSVVVSEQKDADYNVLDGSLFADESPSTYTTTGNGMSRDMMPPQALQTQALPPPHKPKMKCSHGLAQALFRHPSPFTLLILSQKNKSPPILTIGIQILKMTIVWNTPIWRQQSQASRGL